MRLVSLLLVFTCLLLAQSPIGMGPGSLSVGLLDLFDWYRGTGVGCTAGARGICSGSSGLPAGDNYHWNAWFADASLLPITTGLPVVGSANDFTSKTCSGNLMLLQLAAFDWSARNAAYIYEVNCMQGYGTSPGATDTPTGWAGHCTSGDDGGLGCSWKSHPAFVRGGLLYLPVKRQIPAGTLAGHDATIIVSADGGQTWRNPYTVAHSGSASATGDAPAYGGATYPGTIMWQALPGTANDWIVIQYGQDGATPPSGITDGCDPATYTCLMMGGLEGTIGRVLNTDLPSLDVTKWQYYTCPAITDTYRCPGSASSSWTSTFADRTQVARFTAPSYGGSFVGMNEVFSIAYIKEFKSYLMSGYVQVGANSAPTFAWAPTIEGPWTLVLSAKPIANNSGSTTNIWPGALAPSLALGYTVISTDPPRVQITTTSDDYTHTGQAGPYFGKWDLVLGRTPMLQAGENPRYSNAVYQHMNSGLVFSDGHMPGSIPRKDLALAYDFYDHAGDTTPLNVSGFHDLAKGGSFLTPCVTGGYCGAFYPGPGTTLGTYGAKLEYGYGANMSTVTHDQPQTIALSVTHSATAGLTPQNAPISMQGNGTFTVVSIFRYDSSSSGNRPIWVTGNTLTSAQSVSLAYSYTDSNLSLNWGGNATTDGWKWFHSSFTPTVGNWIFVASTVTANGSSPLAHMWVGVSGTLVDELAGVTYTTVWGSPVATPAVTAAPLILGTDPNYDATVNASYAGLFVYNRALTYPEVQLVYRSMKVKMAARGVTLQ